VDSLATRGNNMSKKSDFKNTAGGNCKKTKDQMELDIQEDPKQGTSRGSMSPPKGAQRIPPKRGVKPCGEGKKTDGKEDTRQGPAPGQPGGPGDPLRQGLSGAGIKWYLRFLAQGREPEEARRLAEERRSKVEAPKEQPKKRGRESVTPTNTGEAKRQKRSEPKARIVAHSARSDHGPHTSYASAVRKERVAVLPKDYPQVVLSTGELTELEEAIVEEISRGWQVKPKFEGIHFRPGLLVIDCENKETAAWLKERIPSLQAWKGVALDTKSEEEIPRPHVVTIFLPRSSGDEPKKLLRTLNAQNEGLRVEEWRILASKKEGNGQVLTIGIDAASLEAIVGREHALSYRFGKVSVHEHRRATVAKEEELRPVVEQVPDGGTTEPEGKVDGEHDIPIQDLSLEESLTGLEKEAGGHEHLPPPLSE
jgi:hypothetical protein